jgi:hypothetical protein
MDDRRTPEIVLEMKLRGKRAPGQTTNTVARRSEERHRKKRTVLGGGGGEKSARMDRYKQLETSLQKSVHESGNDLRKKEGRLFQLSVSKGFPDKKICIYLSLYELHVQPIVSSQISLS